MDETPFTARLVTALAHTWSAIRNRHGDVPPVVITLGAGSIGMRPGELKLGHFAAGRWEHPDGLLGELFVGGEGLRRGPASVLETLLHEAAHGAATTRRVPDVSRGGRYHNARYASLARELGLDVTRAGDLGWSGTALSSGTAAEYEASLAELATALTAWRRSESQALAAVPGDDPGGSDGQAPGPDDDEGPGRRGGRSSSNNGVAARCGCEPPRRIRVSAAVLSAGPVICGLCGCEFSAPGAD